MAQVNVTITGKTYRMACEDGQEDHLGDLADRLNSVIEKFRAEFGEIGDQRLTVMAAIALADQSAEADRKIAQLESEVAELRYARDTIQERSAQVEAGFAQTIDQVAARIESVAHRLSTPAGGNGATYENGS